jgi:hypothetical protein
MRKAYEKLVERRVELSPEFGDLAGVFRLIESSL